MFGHKWERAQATIMESRSGIPAGPGMPAGHEFVVDVRRPNGQAFRATISAPAAVVPPGAGAVVGVEVEARTGNVRFDSSDHRLTLKGVGNALQAAQQMRFQIAVDGGVAREVLSSGPTPADAASSGDAGLTGAGSPGLTGAGEAAAADGPVQRALRAAFQSGTPDARVMAGPEAAQMVQGLLSGDRSQRLAAVEALKQLKANRGVAPSGPASQPAPASTAGPSAPATFDPMGPASPGSFNPAHPSTPSTFSPVNPAVPVIPATPSALNPVAPSTPSTFDAVSPINTFNNPVGTPSPASPGPGGPASSFSSFSSFSAAGRTDQADRIARLQALRDQGLLSSQDFEAQRQRILDEI